MSNWDFSMATGSQLPGNNVILEIRFQKIDPFFSSAGTRLTFLLALKGQQNSELFL